MAISIPSPLVEFILLGPLDDRRQLQDSPILGDVWVEFGKRPDQPQDLLIEPFKGKHAGLVAVEIRRRLKPDDKREGDNKTAKESKIAYLHSLVVAELNFEELLRVVVPMTKWWERKRRKAEAEAAPKAAKKGGKRKAAKNVTITPVTGLNRYNVTYLTPVLSDVIDMAREWHRKTVPSVYTGTDEGADEKKGERTDKRYYENPSSLDRFVALTGLILWAGQYPAPNLSQTATADELIAHILKSVDAKKMAELLKEAEAKMLAADREAPDSLVWQVSLNRRAAAAITRSIPAVKADAATRLFKVNCSDINWAVLDSGIDDAHPCFQKKDEDGKLVSRVIASYDFRNFRHIVSVDNLFDNLREDNAKALLAEGKQLSDDFNSQKKKDKEESLKKAQADLKLLAEDAERGAPIQWNLVERFVKIKPGQTPAVSHGTHVAGIIGASGEAARKAAEDAGETEDNEDFADGVCPDINLYDFRVLGPDIDATEFAVIAALQFIRYLNTRSSHIAIHGANLSLSIPHHVRNYACGHTPICDECERLVESGVVVVAAAGNHGYKSFETREGLYDSYAAFSITDPGNADDVITVGSTHRYSPHTYGVSFFSSRGPTGDGRLKPDIVAPGERIRAPFPGGLWDDLDGTSMAAPHVSGAAAMLMARYSELVGQPRRIKRILCDSATDLGRERSFQGHGMLDVLRAFQSI